MANTSTRSKSTHQPAISLTWEQVRAWRLQRHALVQRAPAEAMLDITARVGGLHAQLMSSAELMLWARIEGITAGITQRALWEERSLVKTWAMRGTLHLLPASEYPLWQADLSTNKNYLKPSWFRYFGVSQQELEHILTAVGRALDGKILTREELATEVASITGAPHLGDKLRESWGMLLKPASYLGDLCFGPNLGQNVRFTHPASWLHNWFQVEPAHAQREITRRFLAAYGPATREDYAHWRGFSPASAKTLITSLGEEVTLVDLEGTHTWVLTADVAEIASASPPNVVNLLPAFDQYVIAASTHLEQLMPGQFRGRIYRPQGWVSPVLLVDGRMDGIWKHERKNGRLVVRVEPFLSLPSWAIQAAEAEAQRLATFMESTLDFQLVNN